MDNERAIEVLEMLLDGIHPVTGEILSENGIHTEPDVIMALYKSVEALYSETGGKIKAGSRQGQYTKRGKLNAGRPWTEEDDQKLRQLFKNQVPVERMCVILQRRPRGINNRLMCLGLMQRTTDRYGNQIKPGLERVGTQWMPEEDARLREMFNEGKPIDDNLPSEIIIFSASLSVALSFKYVPFRCSVPNAFSIIDFVSLTHEIPT